MAVAENAGNPQDFAAGCLHRPIPDRVFVELSIELLTPVHDAVLIGAPLERIEADTALMREIMRRASRIVFNADPDGPHELRTDATIVLYPNRYSDKRGSEIWQRAARWQTA